MPHRSLLSAEGSMQAAETESRCCMSPPFLKGVSLLCWTRQRGPLVHPQLSLSAASCILCCLLQACLHHVGSLSMQEAPLPFTLCQFMQH